MKKSLILATLLAAGIQAFAQDRHPFKGYFYNKEYAVYLRIDFYDSSITVPGQEVFGAMPGYFGDSKDGRKWLFTDAKIKGKVAEIDVVNDYGSEDLKASLTCVNDSTYLLRQLEGSDLKIARNRKWVKMPKTLAFKKRK